MRVVDSRQFHCLTTLAFKRISPEGNINLKTPVHKQFAMFTKGAGYSSDQLRISICAFGVDAIIAKYIKSFFRDMDNQFFNEFKGMLCNIFNFVIFMALIPVCDIGTVIVGDTGLSHYRPADITGDIVDDSISRTKISAGSVDIKTV